MIRQPGRHFLQIPGPSSVPDRILNAISRQVIDHRGPDFAELGTRVLEGLKTVFKTESNVFVFPASGTGAWEAALVNVLSPGDKVLMYETGHFATLWKSMAQRLGLNAQFIHGNWRGGADPDKIEEELVAICKSTAPRTIEKVLQSKGVPCQRILRGTSKNFA